MRRFGGLILLVAALSQVSQTPACAQATAIPPVFLSAGDARQIMTRKADPVITGALAGIAADTEKAVRKPAPSPPYAGCDVRQYISGFSYEYGGAAVQGAALANYAYLHAIDPRWGNDAVARAAGARARTIVVSWARDGFRKPDGQYRIHPADFCDGKHPDAPPGRGVVDGLGLQIGRGVPAYVHAADLLGRVGALGASDRSDVVAFMRRLGSLVREAATVRAGDQNFDCNRYSNHTSIAVAAMVAVARATGDERWRRGLMDGDKGAAAIAWPAQVDHAIYARTGPPLSCYRKPPGDPLWQPDTAYPGEVADRYRQVPGQTFGYITYSLLALMKPLVIDAVAGGPASAHAAERQRIGLALDYYARYLQAIGPDAAMVPPAAASWPGGQAYVGKVVSAPGCASERGSDHLIQPFAAAGLAHVPSLGAARLVARIESDRRCPAPLSSLDPVLIGAYAHLPAG